MSQEKTNYTKVGIFTTIIILVFILGYKFISQKGVFDNSIKLYSLADNVMGISTETPIFINGFQIGKVNDITLKENKVLLEFAIDKEYKLAKSSKFVSVTSVFGDRHIDVKDSREVEEFYKHQDTVETEFVIQPIGNLIDSTLMKEFEPTLKEVSRTIGKALQDYGESDKEIETNKDEK